ncbi:hypothetical protein SprV_1002848600 [Sparganum proliferum]
MGPFGHMRIYESGIDRSTDSSIMPNPTPTSPPCAPAAPHATDTDTTDFTCPYCPRTFSSRIGLVGHLRIHRTETGEPVPGAPTYTHHARLNYAHCPCTFRHRMGLFGHMRIHDDPRNLALPLTPSTPSPPPLSPPPPSTSPPPPPPPPPPPHSRLPSRQTGMLSPLTLAAGGVRSLLENPGDTRPERTTALMAREQARYKVDIIAISDTRFSEQGQLEEVAAGYTFCSGRSRAKRQDTGVTSAIRNDIVGRLPCLPLGMNDRLMSLRFPHWGGEITILVNIFATPISSADETRNKFYAELHALLASEPTNW